MQYVKINPQKPDSGIIDRAVKVLKKGGIIVYPTDTLYGLGVDVNNVQAVYKLYLLKQRDLRLPISLMVASIEDMEKISGKPDERTRTILTRMLPGKFTVLLNRKKGLNLAAFDEFLPEEASSKIGFRIPDSPLCQQISAVLGNPISSTSANISGKGNLQSVRDIVAHFGDKLDLILDAGALPSKAGSTIIDLTKTPLLVKREGDISLAEVRKLLNDPSVQKSKDTYTITFVCSGNICRSAMAEGLLKALMKRTKFRSIVAVNSAGTLALPSSPAHETAIKIAAEQGVDIRTHRSRFITKQIVEQADLIIAMARDHLEYLQKRFPEHRKKVVLLKEWKRNQPLFNPSIADPIGHDPQFFREVFNGIRIEIKRIMPYLFEEIKKFMDYNDIG